MRNATAVMAAVIALFTIVPPQLFGLQYSPLQPPQDQQVTLLADAPSVKLHVNLKRKSARIHGQSEFDIFAKPTVSADGASALYDGYATFVDGDNTFTYSYVNGVGYLSTSEGDNENLQCISSTALPFNEILPALNDATPIPSASIGDEAVKCVDGNLFKTTLAGAQVALCSSDKEGLVAYSSDFTVEVKYLESSINIPKLSTKLSCGAVGSLMTSTGLALLTGTPIAASYPRQLRAEEHMEMEASSCECKSTPRPCVFFHGIGSTNELEELQDTPDDTNGRIGDMNDHAPCCTDVKYAVLNMTAHSWRDDSIQEKFCDRALRLSESSDQGLGVIQDTVVVTHSMAGLVMSMALATGKCSFGEGASWVVVSSPMMGSMAADFQEDICNDEYTGVTTGFFELLGKCPMPPSRRSLMYQNEKYASADLNAAYAVAQEAYRGNVTAAMCSNKCDGVFSKYQAVLSLAGRVLPHKFSENDGLVEYQSCAIGLDESLFGTSYKDKFYKPRLNHADTAFLSGDGLFKDAQKPVKWFECLL